VGAPTDRVSQPLRRIWLCADDYGIAPGVNAAIRDLIMRRRINATSAMMAAPSFSRAEAVSLSILNASEPLAAIGLHITLTAPFRPLSKDFLPTHRGVFLPLAELMRRALFRRLDRAALAREIAAQLDAFAAAFGRAPDFIDGHQHVHLLPQVCDAVVSSAKALAPAAWLRQAGNRQPLHRRLADPKGLLIGALSTGFRRRANGLGLSTNPAFAGTYGFGAKANFASLFPTFLDGLPDGGLIMCHPGFVDDELRRLDPLTDLREEEYAYLASDAFPALLAAHGVELAAAA
jgi:predicted glycoside hydrolase/deacetylase ChbG (UPF0249 family)